MTNIKHVCETCKHMMLTSDHEGDDAMACSLRNGAKPGKTCDKWDLGECPFDEVEE